MAVSVTLTVLDRDGNPVEDLVIQVYDSTGTNLVISGATDGTGELIVSLDEVFRYQLRFYGEHILATVPTATIKVVVPPPANEWQFSATTFVPPVSPDPHMCRLWGFFLDAAGRRAANLPLRFMSLQNPAVLRSVIPV